VKALLSAKMLAYSIVMSLSAGFSMLKLWLMVRLVALAEETVKPYNTS